MMLHRGNETEKSKMYTTRYEEHLEFIPLETPVSEGFEYRILTPSMEWHHPRPPFTSAQYIETSPPFMRIINKIA